MITKLESFIMYLVVRRPLFINHHLYKYFYDVLIVKIRKECWKRKKNTNIQGAGCFWLYFVTSE